MEEKIQTQKVNKVGFFEEELNVKSSTRLNSHLLLWFFMGFNLMWINGENDITGNLLLFDAITLVSVFAPKYLHKILELSSIVKTKV